MLATFHYWEDAKGDSGASNPPARQLGWQAEAFTVRGRKVGGAVVARHQGRLPHRQAVLLQCVPGALQAVSDWLPLSYAIDAVTAVTAGDDGWTLWGPLLIVAAFAVGALVLASLTLRRRTP